MKFSPFAFISLFSLGFSSQVAAGDAHSDAAQATPAPSPASWWKFPSFDVEAILTSGPVASALAKAGVNITERFQDARKHAEETGWLAEIPLITDQNYKSLIVEERLSPEEEEKRVWFLVVSIPKKDPITEFVDNKVDAAYNLTRSARDMALPNVKWGRINYLDVTALTTKWWIWKAPVIVVLRHRGNELRFYNQRTLNLDRIHKFLEVEGWRQSDPWTGAFAPGGSLDPYMDKVADWAEKSYVYIATAPRWLLLLGTGAIVSAIMNLLHSKGTPAPKPTKPTAPIKRIQPPRQVQSKTPSVVIPEVKPASEKGSSSPKPADPPVLSKTKDASPSPAKRKPKRQTANK